MGCLQDSPSTFAFALSAASHDRTGSGDRIMDFHHRAAVRSRRSVGSLAHDGRPVDIRRSELSCAPDTGRKGRIDIEAARPDLLATLDAIAELTLHHALQRSMDGDTPRHAAALDGMRHCLRLHGVDARDAADALLVQFDRRAPGGVPFAQPVDFGQLLFESRSKAIDEFLVVLVHRRTERVRWRNIKTGICGGEP